MSVLIKGLEIPEEGAIRAVIQKHCGIAVAYTGEDPYQRAHEVIELPEKHGDLIDRNKLLFDIEEFHLSDGKFQHWVEVQNAIVEAEGEEQ